MRKKETARHSGSKGNAERQTVNVKGGKIVKRRLYRKNGPEKKERQGLDQKGQERDRGRLSRKA